MSSLASPEIFFGSKEYFQGACLNTLGYSYVDALTVEHDATGIKMWSCAIDIREAAGHQGLREGDRVLFHYTTEDSFKKITSLQNRKLLAPLDGGNKDSYFGLGIYATMHAPHQWKSKEEVLVNNYYPTRDNFKSKQGLDLPQPDVPFNAALNGAVGDFVKDQYKGKADCCLPLIVDEQVSKNVMEEITDGPLMPNGRKRLKGTNCFGEKQPVWRDVWLVSIYEQSQAVKIGVKDAQQSSDEIVQILEKRLETDEWVQSLATYGHEFGLQDYREIRKKLLVKVIEVKPKDSHGYNNLGTELSPEETVQAQLPTGVRTFNQQELYLEAIKLDNNFANAYYNLGNTLSSKDSVTVQLQTGPRTFKQKQLFLETINLDNNYALAYYNLGVVLSPQEIVKVQLQTGPRRFNKKELFLEAIKLDNNNALVYYTLGLSLSPEETVGVQLENGCRTFNQKDLFLEAIRWDNNCAHPYAILGAVLSREETVEVQLQTGPRTFNHPKELFLEAIRLDNNYALPFAALGIGLSREETVEVQLQTGPRTFNAKELFLEAIRLDNNYALAYNNLGNRLSPEETVQVHLQAGPKTFNAKELFLEAIRLDNSYATAYNNLGHILAPKETVEVQLQTGVRIFTKEDLMNWRR